MAMAPRSPSEVELFSNAAAVSDIIIQKQILPTIEQCLDEGTDVTHAKIAEDAEQLYDPIISDSHTDIN